MRKALRKWILIFLYHIAYILTVNQWFDFFTSYQVKLLVPDKYNYKLTFFRFTKNVSRSAQYLITTVNSRLPGNLI